MSDELAVICDEHRRYARARPIIPELIGPQGYRMYLQEHPLEVDSMSYLEFLRGIMQQYSFKYGKFFVEITLRAPGMWHSQVTILEDIGELEWGVPQQALLAMESWTNDDFEEAREILGTAIGPEVIYPTQKVVEHKGQWSLHWQTKDERANERDDYGPEAKN